MTTRITAAIKPLVPSVTRTATVPATRMPTSGTNAARKTRMVSGTSSGTPRIHSEKPDDHGVDGGHRDGAAYVVHQRLPGGCASQPGTLPALRAEETRSARPRSGPRP